MILVRILLGTETVGTLAVKKTKLLLLVLWKVYCRGLFEVVLQA